MRGGDIYAHMCASLCSSNGQPAIQAKYTYSTLLPAFLFGCVVYASATWSWMYFKGIVAWDGYGPILSLFLSYLNRKCSTVTLFCTVQQWLSIPELMHSIKWKENVALITLARCQVTFWKTEKKKKYFEVSMKQDGSVIKFYICLAQTEAVRHEREISNAGR